VLALLDDEKQARTIRDEMVTSKLIRSESVILVSEAFDADGRPSEADIEDLIDPAVYEALARESYARS